MNRRYGKDMERTFTQALEHRRSYYALSAASTLSDEAIERLLDEAALHVPSAFNSQSTRIVLLLGAQHRRLWDIVLEKLERIVPPEAFDVSRAKIERSFASGYGTVLFYEDTDVVRELERRFPTYSRNFVGWSHQTSAMNQLAVWTMLEDAGMGASLQHYNPLIDRGVQLEWSLPESWELVAQMPFGVAVAPAGDKSYRPLSERVFVYK